VKRRVGIRARLALLWTKILHSLIGLTNILILTSRCLSAEADQIRRSVIVAMGESLQQQIPICVRCEEKIGFFVPV